RILSAWEGPSTNVIGGFAGGRAGACAPQRDYPRLSRDRSAAFRRPATRDVLYRLLPGAYVSPGNPSIPPYSPRLLGLSHSRGRPGRANVNRGDHMKELAASAAVVITVLGTGPYLVGMLRREVRPHAVTWFVWTVTTLVAFIGQVVGGGGLGAAAAGASALVGAVITGWAVWRGDRAYTHLDRLCLVGASAALLGWAFAGQPLLALLMIALVDVLGALPT